MRDILLDQLLNDFYNSAFPGFTSKLTVGDPVLSTPVPVVDIPMHLDTDLLLEYAKQIELDPMQRTTYPYEQHPRFVGWNIQVLWSNDYNNTLLGDIYYKKTTAPVAVRYLLFILETVLVSFFKASPLSTSALETKKDWPTFISANGYLVGAPEPSVLPRFLAGGSVALVRIAYLGASVEATGATLAAR
jgi:hypothetical protein